MQVVRSRSRVNPSVARSIELNLPVRGIARDTEAEWRRMAGTKVSPDPEVDGTPTPRTQELDLRS